MKKNKVLLALAFTAVAFATTASAQTKIYITGATAFRSAAHQAILDTLTGETIVAANAATTAAASGADAVTYSGGTLGTTGIAVTIKTSWAGSTGGIQLVAASSPNLNQRFLPDSAGLNALDPRNVANPAELANPDMCFSDCYQANSVFRGAVFGNNYLTLVDKLVGVVTFEWVASDGFPATNMSRNLAKALMGGGVQPVAMFTGSTADQNKSVYLTGRDPDSGTRVITLTESGFGAFSTVQHYRPATFSSGNASTNNSVVSSVELYPIQTVNGVSTNFVGNGGESSGSTMRRYLTNTFDVGIENPVSFNPDAATYMVGAMSVSDANNIAANAGPRLTWNGVAFSEDRVRQGTYTFWSYQHLMYKSTLSGTKLTFAQALETNTKNFTNVTPNVRISTMQCSRTGDGTDVTINYF
jgi:hypothetical protein